MPTAVGTDNIQSANSLLLRQTILLFGLGMIAVLWIGLGWKLGSERTASDARMRSDTANLARAFEESVLRTVQQVDLRLLMLRSRISEESDVAKWSTHVASVPLDDEISFQIAVLDSKGRLVTSSHDLKPTDPIDFSDREHVRLQVAGSSDDLLVSRPLLGRVVKQWSIELSRVIRSQSGETIGVVVASLSPAYLTRLYESIELGRYDRVLLVGADGFVRASTQGADLAAANIQSSDFFQALRGQADGYYTGPMAGSQSTLTAWRKVRGIPLYVAVALDQPSARAAQRSAEFFEMVAAALATLLIALVTTFIVRSQHRIAMARQELAVTARQVEAKSLELRAMIDNISQGIVMATPRGQMLVSNRRARELLGETTDDAFAAAVTNLLATVKAGTSTDRLATASIEIELPGERVLQVMRSFMPDGNIVVTLTDVTLVKRRQNELEMAWHAADDANQAKSQFLSTMSHEMRTPLNGMIGALDLLARTKLDADQSHFVETALQSGEALLVHINDVLDFSKMEAGKLELEPAPFNLRHLIDSVLKIVAPQAEARGNALGREIGDDVPPFVVADPVRVRQVLLNLVGNSVKFTRHGSVSVHVSVVGGSPVRPELLVSIRDTGVGIPAERIENLFKEFSMVDASFSRKEGGTGLGLAICKRLVEAMGGEIGVESRQGHGSTFWFRVALDRAAEMPVDEKPAMDLDAGSVPPLNILLVDDNLTNQMVASRMLAAAGHIVTTASDGLEALQRATKTRYDLILMDVSMPEMDGIEATKRIRLLPEPGRSVPIIALTANAIAGDRERFLAAGMDDYLTKPIRRAAIEARIAKLAMDLGKSRSASAGPSAVGADGDDGSVMVVDPSELDRLAAETAPDVVPLVIEQFVTEAAVRAREIQEACDNDDGDALRKAAHALAGASAAVGALRLRRLTKAIEIDCMEGRVPSGRQKVQHLAPLLLETTTTLEKMGERAAAELATASAA